MILLILGVLLWFGAHAFKRLAPEARAKLGEPGKGLVALLIVASIVLMVIGYRMAPYIQLYPTPSWTWHLNNLLMLLAFYLFAVSGAKTALARRIRHPQLTAFKTWAVAHLLVNGDLAALVLFGGLLGWAVWSVIVINRANRDWTRPEPVPVIKEVTTAAIALVAFGAVAGIHTWLGYFPFGG